MTSQKTTTDLIKISLLVLGVTMLVWLPFLLHLQRFYGIKLPGDGIATIKRNYDGLNYVIVAKSLYNADLIRQFPQSLPPAYFAAHFPGYPLLIIFFAGMLGYVNSMLAVSILFTALAAVAFYYLLKEVGITTKLVWLTVLFLLLPPRWLVVHSVGSPEPVFLTFVLMSLLYFIRAQKGAIFYNYTVSGIFGALAMLTRSPGILLFIGYVLCLGYFAYHRRHSAFIKTLTNAYPLLLIPLTLLGVFFVYGQTMADFFAYFHSGDNIHLVFPPFQIFNKNQYWVGSIWLEDQVFYFLIYALTCIRLWQKQLYPLAFFAIVYFIAIISIAHLDIARYSLPLAPLAILAFADFLAKKDWQLAVLIISPAIYLYTINFIANNTFPVGNLRPYL